MISFTVFHSSRTLLSCLFGLLPCTFFPLKKGTLLNDAFASYKVGADFLWFEALFSLCVACHKFHGIDVGGTKTKFVVIKFKLYYIN